MTKQQLMDIAYTHISDHQELEVVFALIHHGKITTQREIVEWTPR